MAAISWRSGRANPSPRPPAMTRSMTAQAMVRQLVSPGKRPMTFVRLRTSSSERSSKFVERSLFLSPSG